MNTDKENYEWLALPKKKELDKGLTNICSTGYDEYTVPESRVMSKNIDALMEEAKRLQTAKEMGTRPPVDKEPKPSSSLR